MGIQGFATCLANVSTRCTEVIDSENNTDYHKVQPL